MLSIGIILVMFFVKLDIPNWNIKFGAYHYYWSNYFIWNNNLWFQDCNMMLLKSYFTFSRSHFVTLKLWTRYSKRTFTSMHFWCNLLILLIKVSQKLDINVSITPLRGDWRTKITCPPEDGSAFGWNEDFRIVGTSSIFILKLKTPASIAYWGFSLGAMRRPAVASCSWLWRGPISYHTGEMMQKVLF